MTSKDKAYYEKLLSNSNVKAYLQVIRKGEGTLGIKGYYTLVGGDEFDDLSRHPHLYKPKYNSTAAGAYQFTYSTWIEIAKKLNLENFNADSQDIAAIYKIDKKNALNDVLNGDIVSAIDKTKGTWVSLPGAKHDVINKYSQNLVDALKFYQQQRGMLNSNGQTIIKSDSANRTLKKAGKNSSQYPRSNLDSIASVSQENDNKQMKYFPGNATDRMQNLFERLNDNKDKKASLIEELDSIFSTLKLAEKEKGLVVNGNTLKNKKKQPGDTATQHNPILSVRNTNGMVRINRNGLLIGNFKITNETVAEEQNNFQQKMEEVLLEILDGVNAGQ